MFVGPSNFKTPNLAPLESQVYRGQFCEDCMSGEGRMQWRDGRGTLKVTKKNVSKMIMLGWAVLSDEQMSNG